jgi:S-formylglutathione hydrolase
MDLHPIKQWCCFGGTQGVWRHRSAATGTEMDFAVFVPAHAEGAKLPVLTFLSGLTCTWENFTAKAGAQRYAAEHGLMLVMPDTSPRGADVPDDPAYDLGQGAGFYVDAAQAPWHANFRMWTYVTEELPRLVRDFFPADPDRQGLCGHSMGGHGALVTAFRNPDRYRSVSAIAPIVAPTKCPWGQKAFAAYLGEDRSAWEAYDATTLAAHTSWRRPILVDQGTADEFLATQLKPELLEQACRQAGIPLTLRMHQGYDHSYYFIATVIGDHVAHHAQHLKAAAGA